MPSTHSTPPGTTILVRFGDETHRAVVLDHRNPPRHMKPSRRREAEQLREALDSGRYVLARFDDGEIAYAFAWQVIGQLSLGLRGAT